MTKPCISFEFFPAKTPAGARALRNTIVQLKAMASNYYSVTYGAGGSTHDGSLSLVKELAQAHHAKVAPHMTCIGTEKDKLLALLKQYQALNIHRLVALRGDISKEYEIAKGLDSAADLITFIRKHSGRHFHIDVAAYPECHPKSPNARADLLNFKAKVAAGADSAITQYFYNPDAYFQFIDRCAKYQIFVPIVPGIMPIMNAQRLIKFSQLCGAEIPRWILKRLADFADCDASLQAFGLEVTQQLCERLIAGGAPGLHFYTLNTAHTTLNLLQSLGLTTRVDAPSFQQVE